MASYSPIECAELKESAFVDISIEGGIKAEVTLAVSSANVNLLVDDLLSNQREWPKNSSSWLRKPRAYRAAIQEHAHSQTVSGQSFDVDTYHVRVHYSTDPDRTLVSEQIQPDSEFVRMDHTLFKWANDNAPLQPGEAPGFLRPRLKLVRKYFNANSIPTAILQPGRVHNAAYTSPSLGLTFDAETLMLMARPAGQTVTTAGSDGFNYEISFAVKYEGWNKYWRPDTQAYDEMLLPDGTTYKSYPPADLSDLLS